MTTRINSNEIVDLFKKHGITPNVADMFCVREVGQCACGIGIYLYNKGITFDFWEVSKELLGYEYRDGFYHGFDLLYDPERVANDDMGLYTVDFKAGFADGYAARKAVLASDLNLEYMATYREESIELSLI